MDNTVGVQIFGASHDLFKKSLGVGFGNLSFLQQVVIQIAILAELRNDVHVIRCLVDIVQLDYIFVADHLHDIDFRLNVFQIVSIQK